jgi:hypothetical protein
MRTVNSAVKLLQHYAARLCFLMPQATNDLGKPGIEDGGKGIREEKTF